MSILKKSYHSAGRGILAESTPAGGQVRCMADALGDYAGKFQDDNT